MRRLIDFINITALNVWFYFWAPYVLLFSLMIYTPYVAFYRIFKPSDVMLQFRRAINRYGKSVALTAWPWIRVRVENLPASEGVPYIFVENHTSSFDPFVQGMLPFELVQAARGWALSLPVLGLVAKFAGYIDVDAAEALALLEKARKLISDGVSIVFFPEGTRYPGPTMGPFHSTAFRVAFETGIPVVPVILSGVADKPRKGSLIMHPGEINMHCLEAVNPGEYKSHTALKKKVRTLMEEYIRHCSV